MSSTPQYRPSVTCFVSVSQLLSNVSNSAVRAAYEVWRLAGHMGPIVTRT